MSRQNSIVVCGGSRLFREGTAALFREAKFRLLGLYANLEEIDHKGGMKNADLVLVIGEKPTSTGILEMAGKLKKVNPACRVVALVGFCHDEERWLAAQAGFDGVLLKSISSQVLCRSLELVLMGEQVFIVNPPAYEPSFEPVSVPSSESEDELPPISFTGTSLAPASVLPRLPAPSLTTVVSSRREGLSERELDVLDCLVNGYSNKLIARRCNITEATVKVHLKAILRKISVANRTQAAVWAINKMHMTSSQDEEAQKRRAAAENEGLEADSPSACEKGGETDDNSDETQNSRHFDHTFRSTIPATEEMVSLT